MLGFAALALAAVAIELAARRPNSPLWTVGDCLAYITRPRLGRLGVLLAWLWVGWHFFAR
ncbi:MAG: hypothetical protein GEV03_09405 [Streptosporangiales bacterium]|nr:hypothetical protein [Streptosporangiales bacterium]